MLQYTGNLPPIKEMKDMPFEGAKIALFGGTGTGKTRSVMSCPKPCLYITSENKYSSVTDRTGLKIIELESFQQFVDSIIAFSQKSKEPNFPYKTIFIDSLTDIADKRLLEIKPLYKDVRLAYSVVLDEIIELIYYIKLIKCNVITIFKQERLQDDEMNMVYGPMLPGNKLGNKIPYEFDEIYCSLSRKENGSLTYYFQTVNDNKYSCKSCCNVLKAFVDQDFSMIINLIMSRYEHFDKIPDTNK